MVELKWTTPELIELNMSAEIGAYQDEYDGERDPRFIEPSPEANAD